MKLLLISAFPYQGSNIGGVSTVAQYLVEHLASLKEIEEIVVFSFRPEFKINEVIKGENSKITIYYVPAQKFLSRLLWHQPDFINLQRLLKSIHFRPDIIHGQGVAGDGLLAVHLGRQNNIPVVVSVHGMVDIEAKMNSGKARAALVTAIMNSTIRNSHGVIFTSHYRLENLKAKCTGKIYLIENSVSESFFQNHAHAIQLSERMIISVGRIDRRKCVTDLLHAFKIVCDTAPHTKLYIIGNAINSEYLQEIHSLIRSLILTDNVILTGEISEKELIGYYEKAHLFVMSSIEETAPQALAQALANGLPVVSTNVGGIPYMVKDAQNGYLVNAGDIAMLAEKMMLLLHDTTRCESFGNSARQEGERFRGKTIARQTLNAYTEVIADYSSHHK